MNEDIKQHLIQALKQDIRFDGRKLLDYREIQVETGIISTAEGSARVKFGTTDVVAGVKLSVGQPYPDTPDEGTISVNAEFLPLSNPDFEGGPPGIESIELARVVDRGIRESKTIDLKKLCIKKGEKVWVVSIDICTLNDNGNLLDASSLAALAALLNARLPELEEGTKVNYKAHTKETLPLSKLPIAVTLIKLGENIIVDPLPEEEKSLDARFTVTFTEDNLICALQKGGDAPLNSDDLAKMIDIAQEKSAMIRSYIKG